MRERRPSTNGEAKRELPAAALFSGASIGLVAVEESSSQLCVAQWRRLEGEIRAAKVAPSGVDPLS